MEGASSPTQQLSSSSSGVSLYALLPNDWASGARPPPTSFSSSAVSTRQSYLHNFSTANSDEEVEDEDHGEEVEENQGEEQVQDDNDEEEDYAGEHNEVHHAFPQSSFGSYSDPYAQQHEEEEEEVEEEEPEDEQEEGSGIANYGYPQQQAREGSTSGGLGFMGAIGPYGMPWYAGASSATTTPSSSFTNVAGAFFGGGSRTNSFVYGASLFGGVPLSSSSSSSTFAVPTPTVAATMLESANREEASEDDGVHAELKEFPKHSQVWTDGDVYHPEVEEEEEDDESQDDEREEPLPAAATTASPSLPSEPVPAKEATVGSSISEAGSTDSKVTRHSSSSSVLSTRDAEPNADFERPTWVEDKYAAACAKCTVDFSTFKRRHHCRGCGKVFCADCSAYFLVLPSGFGYKAPQRTCRPCYVKHSALDYSTKYDTFGPEDAPLVVLLHGAAATRKSFALQIEALKADYRLVVPDLPGHGSRDNQQFTMQSAMDVVEEVIRAHSPEKRAIIFGYGLGGFVAMSLAGARPYLCRAIVVGGAASNQTERGSLILAILSLMWSSIPKPLLSRAGRVTLDKYTRISEDLVNELFLRPGIQYAAWPDILHAVGSNDFGKHLTLYPGPVLFFHGEHDNRHSEGEWSRAARKARVEVINDAGQWVLVDERYHARVSALVSGFVQDVLRMEEEEEKRKQDERERELARRQQATQPARTGSAAGPAQPLPDSAALFKDTDWLFAKE